jgi:flagellar hook-associated protein 1 FlgK
MASLNTSLQIAVQALQAQQGGLTASTNNIANVNTPGYTRKEAVFTESAPISEGNLEIGTGVELEQFKSVRDDLLNLRINQETQQQSSAQAQVDGLQQVESMFSNSSAGIGADMSAFFASLSQLTTNPADLSNRQAVLGSAQNLASSFQQASSGLSQVQQSLNQDVTQTVTQVNQLTGQIATLNQQVAQMQSLGEDTGSVGDQRDQLVQQLSGLIDVSVISTNQGETLTTSNGSPLVVGGQSYSLNTGSDAGGMPHVYAQGRDITSSIQGGQIGGDLQCDQTVAGFASQLDTLAAQFSSAINTVQQAGFDLAGNPGQNLFTPVSGPGAAANFSVATTDPSAIAAGSTQAAGDGGNLTQMIDLQNQALPSGQTPLQSYSNLVFQVGQASAQAQANVQASTLIVNQLTDTQSSISGVSIDQETTNLIQYQNAYQAAARVITTVDDLTQSILSMASQNLV